VYALVTTLLQPYTFLCLLMAGAIVNIWRKRRETRGRLLLVTLPFVALVFLSTGLASFLLLAPLQFHYPPLPQRPPHAEAIVVLGGYVSPPNELRARPQLGVDTLYRCLHAADLYHQGKPCPIVVSGGKVNPQEPGPTIARAMQDMLLSLRVCAEDIIVEDGSRTTYENAVESCKLLTSLRIRNVILVTDAQHMIRAVKCFQKQGVEILPSGCHYQEIGLGDPLYDFLPNAEAAKHSQQAAHEWVGVLWYWLRGKI
jgi:uncharacterized SAM-binding protein YcdF (DUF218 family)